MSSMLQPNDVYRERAQRHQAEARRWAEIDRLGRLARASRPTNVRRTHQHHHTLHTHLRALRMHLRTMLVPNHAHRHHRA